MKSIIKTLKTAKMLFEPVRFRDGYEIPIHYLEINQERLINVDELAAVCRCDVVAFTLVSDSIRINNQEFVKAQHVRQTFENFEIPKEDLAAMFREPEWLEYYNAKIPDEVKRAVNSIIQARYGEYQNSPVEWLATFD